MPFGNFLFVETSPAAPGTVASSQTVQNAASYLPAGVAGPIDDYESIDFTAELVGATGGTLDVYIQDSPDGVNWFDIVHFTQLTNGAAAVKYNSSVSLFTNATAPVAVGKNLAPALAAGTSVNGPFTDRVRLVMVAGSGTTAGAAVRVSLVGQRQRTREIGE